MKRPSWDKFAGAEYTIGSDVLMPDGKLIQQPSTHLLGQHFSKAFKIKFKNEQGKEDYVWQTCYGPAPSRILASVISIHGDNKGLIIPYCISPIQVVIVPIYTKDNKDKILEASENIKERLEKDSLRVEIDSSEKRPGEKYFFWELRGVPFRLEFGGKEMKAKEPTLFTRDTNKKEKISVKDLSRIMLLGEDYDLRLKNKADKFMQGKITNCTTKEQIKKAIKNKKIARVNFCSIDKEGEKCAAWVEKEAGAEVRGVRADKKETPKGKCVICNKDATEVVYIGRSY
jgi:prolyl-tRNA synthetase